MIRRTSWALPTLAVLLLAFSLAAPVANGASDKYLTVALTQSGMKQSTIGGYDGILANFTNTYTTPVTAFVYMDLVNSAGQTIYWNVGSCSFSASQKAQCFVTILPSVPRGTYTAWLFATTNSSVPISTFSSVQVTV